MRTELIADQPLVVFLHDGQGVVSQFKEALRQREVEVVEGSVSNIQLSQLERAYLICWLVTPEWFAQTPPEQRMRGLVSLGEHQKKVAVVAPVVSHFESESAGEFPLISQLCRLQQQMTLEINKQLPIARWIFIQDLIAPIAHVRTTIAALISQELQLGKIYAPNCSWFPISLADALPQVVKLMLQPSKLNYIIRGQPHAGARMAGAIQNQYQSVYFSPIVSQEARGSTSSPTPFSVTDAVIHTDITNSLREFVTKFPSPRAAVFHFSWSDWDTRVEEKGAVRAETTSSSPAEMATEEGAVLSAALLKNSDDADMIVDAHHITAKLPHNSVREYGKREKPELDEVVSVEQNPTSAPPDNPTPTPIPSPNSSPTSSGVTTTAKPVGRAPEFNLSQEVSRVFATTHLSTKRTKTATSTKERLTFVKKTRKRTALFYGGLAFTGMGLGILFLIVVFMTTLSLFRREVRGALNDVTALISNDSSEGVVRPPSFSSLKQMVHVQADVYGAVLSLPAIDGALELVTLAETIEEVGLVTDRSLQTTQNLVYSILNSQDTNVEVVGPNLQADGALAYEKLELLADQMGAMNTAGDGDDDSALDSLRESVRRTQNDWRDNLIISQQISPVLPQMLAAGRQRRYAVLFQNNQELRPTGGFIEAVAIITLSQDGLVGYDVYNSYQINRRVPGAVKAPDEIKRYLGEEQLNFHDSNWDPHFPTTAEQVTWFLSKSLEIDLDGVLTIDVDGLATILEHLGPLELSEYNEVVTHRTLAERVEFHSEVILVADEDKKDYRQVLFEGVLDKIRTTPREKTTALLRALRTNLEQQNMLFVPIRAEELQAMTVLGWTGAILSPPCPTQLNSVSCQIETIGQFEANVGVNKANFYLEREIEHVVVPLGDELYHERMITYTNTAQSNSWPKGPYKAYVRLYLPETAELQAIKVGSSTLEEIEITQSKSQQKNTVGFLIEVPTRNSVPVVVSFTTPFAHKEEKTHSYALFEQYQPGSGTQAYRLRFTPPKNYSPSLIAPQPDVRGDDLLFVRDMRAHSLFGVQLDKIAE